MKTIKIKITKLQQISCGILYEWYSAENINTGEKEDATSNSYYGDDILVYSVLSEEELLKLPTCCGKRESKKKIIEEKIHTYSFDNAEEDLKKEGWADEIEDAISSVLYEGVEYTY